MTRQILIDTDPGIDDAMAICYALESPVLDVIGLTTVFGNVNVERATTNALQLLEIAERPDIPVAKGASAPLNRAYIGPVPHIHGDDGQGNVHLPPPQTEAIDEPAAVFIVEAIMNAPRQITLVPIGPLTNIALALKLEPRIADRVQEVVLMGGAALVPGNVSPAAEANVHNDPEAADVVFGAGWPLTMVGLDVTHEVVMTPEHFKAYERSDKPLAQHIAKIIPFYHDFFKAQYDGREGIFVHDSTAISYLLRPDLFETIQSPVWVDTVGRATGKTWVSTAKYDHGLLWDERASVTVCTGIDAEKAIEAELALL